MLALINLVLYMIIHVRSRLCIIDSMSVGTVVHFLPPGLALLRGTF